MLKSEIFWGRWVFDNADLSFSISYSKNFTSPTIKGSASTANGALSSSHTNVTMMTHHIQYNNIDTQSPPSSMFSISQVWASSNRSGGSSGHTLNLSH